MTIYYKAKHRRKNHVQEAVVNILAAIIVYPAIGFTLIWRWFMATPSRRFLLFILSSLCCFCIIRILEMKYFLNYCLQLQKNLR